MLMLLLGANVAAFLLCGLDKLAAVRGWWRISENALLCWALAFGSFGLLLGMTAFHHKTRKAKFRYGVPAILAAQVLLGWAIVHAMGAPL